MLQKLFHDFLTLFVVFNPIGTVSLFIAIAGHEPVRRQRQIATQGVIVAAAILLSFILVGQPLLEALGIDLVSFQIAGGLVLLIIALRMVLEEVRVAPADTTTSTRNVAIFPLAMPFLAGPASIMAVVLLTDNHAEPRVLAGISRAGEPWSHAVRRRVVAGRVSCVAALLPRATCRRRT